MQLSFLRFLFYLIAILVLELAVFPTLNFGRLTPQVILTTVVLFAFNASWLNLLVAVGVGGFFIELYSGLPFGVYMLGLLACAAMVVFLVNHVFPKENSGYIYGSVLVLSQLVCWAVVYSAQWLIVKFGGGLQLNFSDFFSWYFVGQIFVTVIVGYVLTYFSRSFLKPQNNER
jgi:hypothetical protein